MALAASFPRLLLDSGLSSGGSYLCDSSHVESRTEGEKGEKGIEVKEGGRKVTKIAAIDSFPTRHQLVGQQQEEGQVSRGRVGLRDAEKGKHQSKESTEVRPVKKVGNMGTRYRGGGSRGIRKALIREVVWNQITKVSLSNSLKFPHPAPCCNDSSLPPSSSPCL